MPFKFNASRRDKFATAKYRVTNSAEYNEVVHSTASTLAGIETAHMIRKGQLGQNGVSPFKQFGALAA